MILNIILTLLIASIFSYIALKLKIPAGALIGAIFGTILLNLFTEIAYFPPNIKILSSCLVGTYLGCRITMEDVLQMKTIAKPAFFMVVIMLAYNLISSLILSKITGIDFNTAFFALAPGGVTDMTLAAMDMGANVATVSTIQVLRLILVMFSTPFIIKQSISYYRKKGVKEETLIESNAINNEISKVEYKLLKLPPSKRNNLLLTLIIGAISGIIGKYSGFPAGNLCFPIIAVAAFNIFTEKGFMPLSLRLFAQTMSGVLIGMQFSIKDVLLIWDSIIPILFIISGWIILNQILGILINRISNNISISTALFSSAAGGLTDMGIIAAEMGGNTIVITTFQFARVLSILLFYPAIVKIIVSLGFIH